MNKQITEIKMERMFNDSLSFEEIMLEMFEALIDKEYNNNKDLPLKETEVAE